MTVICKDCGHIRKRCTCNTAAFIAKAPSRREYAQGYLADCLAQIKPGATARIETDLVHDAWGEWDYDLLRGNGTTIRPWAERMRAQGWTVEVPVGTGYAELTKP